MWSQARIGEAPVAVDAVLERTLSTLPSWDKWRSIALADRFITPPAGGQVVLRVLAAAEGGAVLEVEDSGEGIAAAEREKVFRPFYRSASSMEIHQGGTGLGLAIVREVAAVHGARIVLAQGGGGRGLKVSIAFPPSKQQDAPAL